MSEKTQLIITAKDETRAAIASAQRGLQSLAAAGARLGDTFASIGVGGGLIGLIGGAGLVASVKATVDSLDALNDSVERLGISAEDLSALNFAGKMNGVAADEMAEALKKLSVKMKEAGDGSKEATKLFDALGVKVTDSSGRLKSADAVFAELADAFAEIEDGAGKTALAVEAFGKSGAKLVPVLNGGAEGLRQMREEAGQLGAIMDGKLVKQAAEFNDNMDRLKTLSEAAGIAIASNLVPWLNEVATSFLIAQKHSTGFIDSLSLKMPGLQSVNVSNELKTLRAELDGLEKDRQRWVANGNSTTDGSTKIDSMIAAKKRQLEYYKELQRVEALANSEGNYGNEGRGLTGSTAKRQAPSLASPEEPAKRGGGARAQADEAARLIATLREKVALTEVDLQSTDRMTAAEKEAAKIKYQLEAGILKATGAQRESIFASLDNLAALEKLVAEQEDYRRALESAETSNVKNRQGMIEQIAAAEKAAELFGLNAAQISVVEQARLADAIAIAKQNGASEDQIAFLEEELAMRGKLSDALIKGETKSQQKQDAEDAIKAVGELDEFGKQAARNMETAFADFFMSSADGFGDVASNFGKAVQRMIAEAASAQLLKLLLGDMGKTGELGGLLGKGLDWASSLDFGDLFSFANGGIMTSAGPLPLKSYSMGGIANSPQLSLFGEGRTPEAYVPLPDGRRIPVAMQGGGGANIVVNVNSQTGDPAEIRRSAAAGARTALGLMSGARRYG